MKLKAKITDLQGNVRWAGEIDADLDPDAGRTNPVTITFTLPAESDPAKELGPLCRPPGPPIVEWAGPNFGGWEHAGS